MFASKLETSEPLVKVRTREPLKCSCSRDRGVLIPLQQKHVDRTEIIIDSLVNTKQNELKNGPKYGNENMNKL